MLVLNQTWWESKEAAPSYLAPNFYAIIPRPELNGLYSPAYIFPSFSPDLGLQSNRLLCILFVGLAQDADSDPRFIGTSCQIHSALYDMEFNYFNGEQFTNLRSVIYSEIVPYRLTGGGNVNPLDSSQPVLSYQAIRRALYQQIVGYASAQGFTTRIQQTSLAAAQDIQDMLSFVYTNNDTSLGLESLVARNRSIGQLIEELSYNITISLFSNPSFL
jgi:hypothetical protein